VVKRPNLGLSIPANDKSQAALPATLPAGYKLRVARQSLHCLAVNTETLWASEPRQSHNGRQLFFVRLFFAHFAAKPKTSLVYVDAFALLCSSVGSQQNMNRGEVPFCFVTAPDSHTIAIRCYTAR